MLYNLFFSTLTRIRFPDICDNLKMNKVPRLKFRQSLKLPFAFHFCHNRPSVHGLHISAACSDDDKLPGGR